MKRQFYSRKRFPFKPVRALLQRCQKYCYLLVRRRPGRRSGLKIIGFTLLSFVLGVSIAGLLALPHRIGQDEQSQPVAGSLPPLVVNAPQATPPPLLANGRPQVMPLPESQAVWHCEVVVVGGSLGGIAAAAHAMRSGATTCLIELTPWLGGQISAQGVSAIDESRLMSTTGAFSQSWVDFKGLLQEQVVRLPHWASLSQARTVAALNSCWVGRLCFSPQAGAQAAQQLLQAASVSAPGSQWATSTAFKGAEFDDTGTFITSILAVRRVPQRLDYLPEGLFSRELGQWYGWQSNEQFEKQPLRLQAPPGKRLIVIDATDTGELVAWAGIPHHMGTESRTETGEIDAPHKANPDCIQAFTYPFVLAIHNDNGASLKVLSRLQPDYSRQEHQREYSMKHHPMFQGPHNFFNYRRIVSNTGNNPFYSTPAMGDMTVVNWNRGNDWTWMNPPLLLTGSQIDASGQRQNWQGGLATIALRSAQEHALLFAQWLMQTQAQPRFPLMLVTGSGSPMGTTSGLSMVPYIREGRRIVGRKAYGQREFMVQEADLRKDLSGGRDFNRTAIAVVHYAIDLHGCRYRNWEASEEATSAPVPEARVHPTQIPLESLIPQGVDNLLIGGKGIAVTHIVNAVTRIHYSEWSIGAAAGATAGWLVTQAPPNLAPAAIVSRQRMPELQTYLTSQGLRWYW